MSGMWLAASLGHARVFWRRSTAGAAVFDNTPGWRTVYRAAVRVNGRPGVLRVISCDDGIPAAVERMRAAWTADGDGATFEVGAGADTRVAWARAGGRVWRFLLIAASKPGKTVVFSLEQSPADHRQSLKLPAGARRTDLPAYPGCQARLLVENDDTRAAMEVGATAADPATVLNYFRDALADRGYRALAPEAGAAASAVGFLLYGKDGILCCVLARRDTNGQTMVTVLQKKLRYEK